MRLSWLIVIAGCASGNHGDKHESPAGPAVRGQVHDSRGAPVAYTIELPKGLVNADPVADGVPSQVGYVQKDHGTSVASDAEGVIVMVGFIDPLPVTLDEAVARMVTDDAAEIMRKEPIERGFILAARSKDHHTWSVEVVGHAGAKLRCRASKTDYDREVGPESGRLLERICLSLAPVPGAG